jgi:Yip1 domain
MTVDSQAPEANALKTVVDTIVAPKEAFESIRVVPTWGWALAIAIVLAAVGAYLTIPAVQHAMAAGWSEMVTRDPRLAQMTPAQQQSALSVSQKIAAFSWVVVMFVIPIYCLIEAVVMLIFDKLGHGEGSFAKYFAACCNIAVPVAGIGSLVNALVVVLRGPETFNSAQAVQTAIPSLAMLAPGATGKLGAFLATITPFNIWAAGLSIAAMLIIGRVPKLQAWLAGIVLFLIPSLIAVASAR